MYIIAANQTVVLQFFSNFQHFALPYHQYFFSIPSWDYELWKWGSNGRYSICVKIAVKKMNHESRRCSFDFTCSSLTIVSCVTLATSKISSNREFDALQKLTIMDQLETVDSHTLFVKRFVQYTKVFFRKEFDKAPLVHISWKIAMVYALLCWVYHSNKKENSIISKFTASSIDALHFQNSRRPLMILFPLVKYFNCSFGLLFLR